MLDRLEVIRRVCFEVAICYLRPLRPCPCQVNWLSYVPCPCFPIGNGQRDRTCINYKMQQPRIHCNSVRPTIVDSCLLTHSRQKPLIVLAAFAREYCQLGAKTAYVTAGLTFTILSNPAIHPGPSITCFNIFGSYWSNGRASSVVARPCSNSIVCRKRKSSVR